MNSKKEKPRSRWFNNSDCDTLGLLLSDVDRFANDNVLG